MSSSLRCVALLISRRPKALLIFSCCCKNVITHKFIITCYRIELVFESKKHFDKLELLFLQKITIWQQLLWPAPKSSDPHSTCSSSVLHLIHFKILIINVSQNYLYHPGKKLHHKTTWLNIQGAVSMGLAMDHWPWMPELKGIFLCLICEEIFKNGSNIIWRPLKDMQFLKIFWVWL